jgi:hypothetical protein
MPSTTLDAPLEAFKFDGVTLITTVKNRAHLLRVTSPDGADLEMCAFFHLFSPSSVLTPRPQRLDLVLLLLHGGGNPLWPGCGQEVTRPKKRQEHLYPQESAELAHIRSSQACLPHQDPERRNVTKDLPHLLNPVRGGAGPDDNCGLQS